MKRIFHLVFLCYLFLGGKVYAIDLMTVYQEGLIHDAIYNQAIARAMAAAENVAVNTANFLPNIGLKLTPLLFKSANSGPGSQGIQSYSERGYQFNLTLTQTIFNVKQFASLKQAKMLAKKATAEWHAALDDLIIRIAGKYLTILQDEDNLQSELLAKKTQEKILLQLKLQYRAGLKTKNDINIAAAANDASASTLIAAKTILENDKNDLRTMISYHFLNLAPLDNDFNPKKFQLFLKINPRKQEKQQNWTLQASLYNNLAALENLKQQDATHLPILTIQGIYNITKMYNTGGTGPAGSLLQPKGSNLSHNNTIEFNFSFPVFSGGGTVANIRQAQDQYQVTSQQLDFELRRSLADIKQNNFALLMGIQKIKVDQVAIAAARSSFQGIIAQYHAGVLRLIDVLNQQTKLLEIERKGAADKYAYLNHFLLLKKALGELNENDVIAINNCLEA